MGGTESQAAQDQQKIAALEASEAKANADLLEANKTITQLQADLVDRAKGSETELASLRSELTSLRSELKKVSGERDTAKSQLNSALEYRRKMVVANNQKIGQIIRTVVMSIRHQYRSWFTSRTWPQRQVLKEVHRSLHRLNEGVPDYDSDTNDDLKSLMKEVRQEEAHYNIEAEKAARQVETSIRPIKIPESQTGTSSRFLRVKRITNRTFETTWFSCIMVLPTTRTCHR
ncbi:hypothetical protein LINGRAHAP2_LOCUS8641 [Linum grandiflorum]